MASKRSRARVNVFAVIAAGMTVTMTLVYVAGMRSQGEHPLPWVLTVLAAASGLAIYGADARARWAPVGLAAAGMLLLVMGAIAVFSIGVPLVVAGMMATVSGGKRATET